MATNINQMYVALAPEPIHVTYKGTAAAGPPGLRAGTPMEAARLSKCLGDLKD